MIRKLFYFRKVYVFTVERYDVEVRNWKRCGMVLLPDNAYRNELEHALLVFGMRVPRGSDRVIWDYDTEKWVPEIPESPLPRPRVRINDLQGTPLVRLSVRAKNVRELGRKKL